MHWKKAFKTYFDFSKTQSIAVVSLLSILLFSLIFYYTIPYFFQPKELENDAKLNALLAEIKIDSSFKTSSHYSKNENGSKNIHPFPFDPNTISEASFLKMNMREKVVKTILNYRNKGGKFYKKEDLKKIWGLHPDEYNVLEPYISIAQTSSFSKTNYPSKPIIHLNLNKTDTTQLKQISGIGSKISWAIIQYREKLGGFANINQLKEIYMIQPELFEKIKSQLFVLKNETKKININSISFYDLRKHPYFSEELSKAILLFRKNNDYEIKNIEDLKQIELINDELFRKIVPYITLK